MSDDSKMFTSGATQTFVAASFVVAILALGLSIFNFSYTTQATSGLLDLQGAAVARPADTSKPDAAIAALTERVDALEAAAKEASARAAADVDGE